MLVRMRETSVGPDHCWLAGQIYSLPDDVAARLLAVRTPGGQPVAELLSASTDSVQKSDAGVSESDDQQTFPASCEV